MRRTHLTFPAILGLTALGLGISVIPAGGVSPGVLPAQGADHTNAADVDADLVAEPLIDEAEPVTPVAEEIGLTAAAAAPEGLAEAAGLVLEPREAAETPVEDSHAGEPRSQALAGAEDDEPQDVAVEEVAEAMASTAGPLVITATGEVTSDVTIAGVTWVEEDTPAVQGTYLRSRSGDDWSDWDALEITGTENDLPADSRGGTEPMAVIEADEIEVAVVAERAISQPELTVWNPGESQADELAALPESGTAVSRSSTATAAAGTLASAPRVYTRADWGADESMRWGNVATSSIQGVVIHHTAGTNNYSAAQVPAIIRGIYAYHAVTRNWGDVGYNIMVDKFGRAWEGRYGSLQQSIWGAHAAPYNATMFGISVLGNHDLVPVAEAAMDAVARVTAWKFDQHGITARGTTTINGVTLNRVVGHRDVGQTSCPGRYFYPRLGELTNRISAYQTGPSDRSLDRDLTGDGVPDVVARAGTRVQILPGGRGDGLSGGELVGWGWSAARTIDPGDWNGDGTADLMLADSSGRLWLYPGRPDGRFAPRQQVGQGWGAIDMIASGFDWDGDGRPDILGRKAADGSLWLYPSNGRGGFGKARQVGVGWGAIDHIAMVGNLTNGRPTLAARHEATGRLRLYTSNGTGRFSGGYVSLGTGWSQMRTFVGVGDRTGDGVPDLVALDRGGELWQYAGTSAGTIGARTGLAQGWRQTSAVLPISGASGARGLHAVDLSGQLRRWSFAGAPTLGSALQTSIRLTADDIDVTPVGDWDGDGRADLVVRKANGVLMLHRGVGNGDFNATGTRIGNGWQVLDAIVGAGDWMGDGRPGIVAYDGDAVRLYPGDGRGGFDRPIEIASGLTGYNALVNAGHWSGSGAPDLLMRGASSHNLFLWPGNGPGLLLDRRQVGSGWGIMEQLVGVGDLDGDSRPDVLTVDGSRHLWLYPGHAGGRFAPRIEVGTLPPGILQLS